MIVEASVLKSTGLLIAGVATFLWGLIAQIDDPIWDKGAWVLMCGLLYAYHKDNQRRTLKRENELLAQIIELKAKLAAVGAKAD